MTVLIIPRNLVNFRVQADFDPTPVRGNALASGDAAADREAEDEIIARLDAGDVWAWASVIVIAEYYGTEGGDSLGCCSYRDERDFRATPGYWDDMKKAACEDLRVLIQEQLPRGFTVVFGIVEVVK
jgi:hypothetical protein